MGAAQRGDLMLLKHGNQGSPEVFASLPGLRTTSLTFNGSLIDITTADDTSKWRQALEGADIMSLAVSGAGVYKNDATMTLVRSRAMSGQHIDNWQVIIPGLGTFSGPFQITMLKVDGTFKGELVFDITLESAGDIAFA